jgi:threonine/homoserine/homoserine lactone efflux protein
VRRSLLLSAGIIAGVFAVMLLTASGLAAAALAQPALGPILKTAAVLYMLWLAWRIATAPPLSADAPRRAPPSFGTGLFLGAGNPKSYAAMAALFSGFALAPVDPLLNAALKMLVIVALMVGVNLLWLLLGAALTRAFRDPAMNRAINIVFALLLLASVAFAFA